MNKPLKIYMLTSNLNYDSNGFLILYKLLCSDGIHTKGAINEASAIYATSNINTDTDVYKEIVKDQENVFRFFDYEHVRIFMRDKMFLHHFLVIIPDDADEETINDIKNNVKKLYDNVYNSKILYIYHKNDECKHIHVVIPTLCYAKHGDTSIKTYDPTIYDKERVISKINELNGEDVIIIDSNTVPYPAIEYNAIKFYNKFPPVKIDGLETIPKNEETEKHFHDLCEAHSLINSECERQSIELAEKYINSDLFNTIPDYVDIYYKRLVPIQTEAERLEQLYGTKSNQ